MNRPDDTADYLANVVRQSPFAGNFYIWAASGTNDSAYSETLYQVQGMARLMDTFGLNHLTFHEKDGARHEYRPVPEYVYNALPFFFPTQTQTDIQTVKFSRNDGQTVTYNLAGMRYSGTGLVIENGKKILRR